MSIRGKGPLLALIVIVVAASLSAASSRAVPGNLAPNPSFEDAAAGPALAVGVPAGWVLEGSAARPTWDGPAHTGGKAVAITFSTGTPAGAAAWRTSAPVGVQTGTAYSLSAWLKKSGQDDAGNGASIAIRWLDAAGATVGGAATPPVSSPTGWVQTTLEATAPANATSAHLVLAAVAATVVGNEVRFDDVSFAVAGAPTPTPTATPDPGAPGVQPPISAHPRDAASARSAFAGVPPWQYRPMTIIEPANDPVAIRDSLKEAVERELYNHVIYSFQFYGDQNRRPEYLSDNYFDVVVRGVLESARDVGAHITLFDDWDFPSGSAGGQTAANDPSCILWQVREDKDTYVIEQFQTSKDSSPRAATATNTNVSYDYPDLLSPSCMRTYVNGTHVASESHLRDLFPAGGGRTAVGMYSDEPGFYNKTDTVPWTPEFPAYFLARNGYDITPRLRALFRDDGPDTAKVRLDFWRTIADRLVDTWAGPIHDWASSASTIWMGHLMDDDSKSGSGDNRNENLRYGDYFRIAKKMQAPGVDVAFREDELPFFLHQPSSARSESGAAWSYAEGRNFLYPGSRPQDIKGAVDRSLGRGNTMYSLYYSQIEAPVVGDATVVNTLRTQPWSNRIPAWSRYFGRLSQLLSGGSPGARVALLNTWSTQMGMWSMGTDTDRSAYNSVVDNYKIVAAALDESQTQWNFMTEGFVPGAVDGAALRGGRGETYKAIMLPSANILPLATAQAVAAFWRAGGNVLAFASVPSQAAEGPGATPQVRALAEEMFGAAPVSGSDNVSAGGGHAIFLSAANSGAIATSLEAVTNPPARPLSPDGRSSRIAYTQRYPGLDVHLLIDQLPGPDPVPVDHNTPGAGNVAGIVAGSQFSQTGTIATEGKASSGDWTFDRAGLPELWNPETGSQVPAPVYRIENGRTVLPVTIANTGSAVVALVQGDPESRPHVTSTNLPVQSVSVDGNDVVIDALAPASGDYQLEGSYLGRPFRASTTVTGVPAVRGLDDAWTVCFPGITVCQQRGTGTWTLPDTRTGAPPVPNQRTATYSRTLNGLPTAPDLSWFLDLGEVAETVRASMDGAPAGDRNWAPYLLDVTAGARDGAKLDVYVEATKLPTQDAGLIGPAKLMPGKHVRIRIAGAAAPPQVAHPHKKKPKH